jgi:hypothetical protein
MQWHEWHHGFVREIRLSDQLRSDLLAKFCRVDPAAHRAEVQTAICDIIGAGEGKHSCFEVSVKPGAIPNLVADPYNLRIILSMSVDTDARSLVLEFSEASTGTKLETAVMRFSKIRSVMDPYRQIIEGSGFVRFNQLDTYEHSELLRSEIHCKLLKRMALNVDHDDEKDLNIGWFLGRYIGNLIYALFPKGPADDWTW